MLRRVLEVNFWPLHDPSYTPTNFNLENLAQTAARRVRNACEAAVVAIAEVLAKATNYARDRAITSVMSSCCSLSPLNSWTAFTTA
jgi:hypothetical protein